MAIRGRVPSDNETNYESNVPVPGSPGPKREKKGENRLT